MPIDGRPAITSINLDYDGGCNIDHIEFTGLQCAIFRLADLIKTLMFPWLSLFTGVSLNHMVGK